MKCKRYIVIIFCLFFLLKPVTNLYANVYIVFYATYQGKTGHVGIAVSEYNFIVNYELINGSNIEKIDTQTKASLIYYDLWPNDDQFSVWNTGRNIEGEYYKLPLVKGDDITVSSLYQKGIPHKEYYPVDGILKIGTTWKQDQELEKILDNKILLNRPFNGRLYNCCDFVIESLEEVFGFSIKAREFIGLGWSSTPNKLYRQIKEIPGITVIKDAGNKANTSFLGQRVIYKLFNNKKENL